MKCKNCQKEIDSDVKFCPNCGEKIAKENKKENNKEKENDKNKKIEKQNIIQDLKEDPKKILALCLIILAVVFVFTYVIKTVKRLFFSDLYENSIMTYNWEDIVLKNEIPKIQSNEGKIISNSEEYLELDVYNFVKSQFNEYISQCKEKGFVIDINQTDDSFEGFNSKGYKLVLNHSNLYNKMKLELKEPIRLDEIEWPDNKYTAIMPKPESKKGLIEKNDESGFVIYIGETDKEKYKNYIKDCKDKGFNSDLEEEKNHFSAKNQDEYKIIVEYQGNSIIKISMFEREFDIELEVECTENLVLSKYDVNVYLDEKSMGTIKHGTTETYKEKLKEGSHTIKFEKTDDKEVKGELKFDITKKDIIKINISCTSLKVDSKITNLDDINAKKIKMINVVGQTLDKAKQNLKDAGFTNIKEEAENGDTIIIDSNWTVKEQNEETDKEVMSNAEIVLKCKKEETVKNTTNTSTSNYEPKTENTDPYSDTSHMVDARYALEDAIKEQCPFGVKCHWIVGAIAEKYEGDGVWFFKVKVTITNAYGTKYDTTAEGRVDVKNGENVTYVYIYSQG